MRTEKSGSRAGWAQTVVAVGLALALAACGGAMSMTGSPGGVTTGGAQDIGLARNQIAAGHIPSPEAFVIEGMLGEHDIDLEAPACDRAFCLDTAVGISPALDTGTEAAFMVVGFSSNIDIERFHRAPLNLSVVVDKSGSMSGGRIRAARAALHKLVRQLHPGDRISLIYFDSDYDVVVPSVDLSEGDDGLHELIDELDAGGSTDIESALAEGYEQVGRHRSEGRDDRVILLTDARPNSGRTGADSFLELARSWGDQGVGLTVMGVGIDFGQDLTLAISRVPGGNYFYLETPEKLATVFDRDFDLLVTPVAWDFELLINPSPGYRITAAYGVPSWVEGEGRGAVRLHVPTLFLSRNRGAIVLRMEQHAGHAGWDTPLGTTRLGYRTAQAGPATHLDGTVGAPLDEGPTPAGLHDAVMLVNTALALQTAARAAHAGHYQDALDTLDEADALIAPGAFPKERRLVENLRSLVRQRMPEDHAHHGDHSEPGDGHGHEPAPGEAAPATQWIR